MTPLHDEQGIVLLALARNAIAERLGRSDGRVPAHDWLQQPGATFVTLTQQGDLRGCIGSLSPHRPLLDDVRGNAVAAATSDHRFAPLRVTELERTRIEVSLLSNTVEMDFSTEEDALAQLRPGIDGVVLQYGHARGTFLPQVWDSLPEPAKFLAALKQKAGMPASFWDEHVSLSRYTVEKWREVERDG